MDYVLYRYDEEVITVEGFMKPLSVIEGWKIIDFLAYSPEGNLRNIDILFYAITNVTVSEKWIKKFKTFSTKSLSFEYEDFPIYPGAILYLSKDKIYKAVLITKGSNQVVVDSNSIKAYIIEPLKELINNSRYVVISDQIRSELQQQIPKVSVWIWCRALSSGDQSPIINLSSFIKGINTMAGEDGGTWNLTLPPIKGSSDEAVWTIDSKTVNFYELVDSMGFQGVSTINKPMREGAESPARNDFFFEKVIQKNDLIFIRFEPLEMDNYEKESSNSPYLIDKKDLPGKVYDMIGLVDNVNLSINSASNSINIGINGRDLTKLLIEDNFFMEPELFLIGNSAGIDLKGLTRIKNELVGHITEREKSIEFVLKFIINALSGMEVVPGELFEGYKERQSTYYHVLEKTFGVGKAEGIWRIITFLLDKKIEKRTLVDFDIGN